MYWIRPLGMCTAHLCVLTCQLTAWQEHGVRLAIAMCPPRAASYPDIFTLGGLPLVPRPHITLSSDRSYVTVTDGGVGQGAAAAGTS